MEMLEIGNHLINERYFIGLYSRDSKMCDNKYICSIEARWFDNGETMGQVISTYEYKSEENITQRHSREMAKALQRINR